MSGLEIIYAFMIIFMLGVLTLVHQDNKRATRGEHKK
jgi:hypothetical protein